MNPLTIKIKLDNSEAKSAIEQDLAGKRKMVAAAGEAGAAMKSALNQQAEAQKSVDAARSAGMARARDETGKFVAGTKQAGEAGAASYGKINVSLTVMHAGLQKGLQLAGAFGQAMDQAAERYKKLTANFTSERDKLGELANVMGETPDNAFTLKNAAFNKKAGLRFDEGIQFRSAFNNSGQQYKGRTISDAEFAQFEEQSAAYGVAKGYDAKDIGDFAGTVLGFKDRSKLGDKASEDALGKVGSATAILQAGKGDTSTLIKQANRLASSSLNEEELRGAFQDSDEIATVISVMAETSDVASAEMGEAALRGLRDFTGKGAKILAKAGIDARTKFTDAIRKLAPVVEAEARAKGVKIEDVLRENFEDIQTGRAIGVQINKGVFGGAYDSRAKVAADNQGGDRALGVIDAAAGTERVQLRQTEAGDKLVEGKIGARNSRVDLLRQQAETELKDEGSIGTTLSFLSKWGSKIISGGLADTESMQVEDRMAEILKRRGGVAGVDVTLPRSDRLHTSEGTYDVFNREIGKVEKAGASGTRDMTKEQIDEQRRTNSLLEKIAANTQPGPQLTPPPVRGVDGVPRPPTR